MAGLTVGVVMVQQTTFSLDPETELIYEKHKREGAQWRAVQSQADREFLDEARSTATLISVQTALAQSLPELPLIQWNSVR